MNKGLRSWPRPQNVAKIRAMLKLDATSVPGAGAPFPSSAIKNAYNILKVIFNGTGDYTVHFGRPMDTAHFIVQGCALEAGGFEWLVNVDSSDPGRNDRVILRVVSGAGGGLNNALIYVVIFA